jgi:hypothetical protein
MSHEVKYTYMIFLRDTTLRFVSIGGSKHTVRERNGHTYVNPITQYTGYTSIMRDYGVFPACKIVVVPDTQPIDKDR